MAGLTGLARLLRMTLLVLLLFHFVQVIHLEVPGALEVVVTSEFGLVVATPGVEDDLGDLGQ